MGDERELRGDLALILVPQVGRVIETWERGEPFRLVDPSGAAVAGVRAYFRELQATGRSDATLRSYARDPLRWFRFRWAIEVAWDRATRTEAREFSRWLQVSGKPVRPHWRTRDSAPVTVPVRAGAGYAASVRTHSETVLGGFYEFHRDEGTGPS